MLSYEITTPERVVEKGEAHSITLPTTQGYITVLPHHIPLISTLGVGEITIRRGSEEFYMATDGGFVEIKADNSIVILADFAAKAEELDVDVIERAKARAEQLLTEKKFEDDEQFSAVAAVLERELTKLKVAMKHRRHRG